jgi:hypothetical protein
VVLCECVRVCVCVCVCANMISICTHQAELGVSHCCTPSLYSIDDEKVFGLPHRHVPPVSICRWPRRQPATERVDGVDRTSCVGFGHRRQHLRENTNAAAVAVHKDDRDGIGCTRRELFSVRLPRRVSYIWSVPVDTLCCPCRLDERGVNVQLVCDGRNTTDRIARRSENTTTYWHVKSADASVCRSPHEPCPPRVESHVQQRVLATV